MALNKNNKRVYNKRMVSDGQINYDTFWKKDNHGDYFIFRGDGNHLFFENKVFIDRNGNGGCHQRHTYLNGATFQRAGVIRNNSYIQWIDWVLMAGVDRVINLDNRMNNADNNLNGLQGGYNSYLTWFSDRRRDMDNNLAVRISQNGSRAHDAWLRTEDLYNWCLDDICFQNREESWVPSPEVKNATPRGVTGEHDNKALVMANGQGSNLKSYTTVHRHLTYHGRRRNWGIAPYA